MSIHLYKNIFVFLTGFSDKEKTRFISGLMREVGDTEKSQKIHDGISLSKITYFCKLSKPGSKFHACDNFRLAAFPVFVDLQKSIARSCL